MRLVGMKHALAVDKAREGHADKVEDGDEQKGAGYHQRMGTGGQHGAIAHGIFHHKIGQSVTKNQAARIAHKGFGAALGLTK